MPSARGRARKCNAFWRPASDACVATHRAPVAVGDWDPVGCDTLAVRAFLSKLSVFRFPKSRRCSAAEGRFEPAGGSDAQPSVPSFSISDSTY
jgi:hypothetical protein